MCHSSVWEFVDKSLTVEEVRGKNVLEVGSRDFNGTVRGMICKKDPKSYLGVDIIVGPGVDTICDIVDLTSKFGKDSYDVVVSTETLEHVKDWRKAVGNLKEVVKTDGVLIITTRSLGMDYHGYPFDYWRYQVSDMESIFSDFKIESLIKDPKLSGVFLKACKPSNWKKKDISGIKLFSMLTRSRVYKYKWWHIGSLYLLGAIRRVRRFLGFPHQIDRE